MESAAIVAKFNTIKTTGQAQAYAQEVRTKALAAQAGRAQKPPLPSRVSMPAG